MSKPYFKTLISRAKLERSVALALDEDLGDVVLEMESEIKEETPVVSGDLQNSMVGRKTNFLEHEVATNLEYAPFVEYGTSRFAPRAMMRKGAARVEKQGLKLFRRVSNLK